jgi:hypothetical protein
VVAFLRKEQVNPDSFPRGNVVSTRRKITAAFCGSLLGVSALALGAGTAFADADPPGNNGTIKIDDTPFDDHPNNEPHVGCTFQVDFYGYDKGDLFADVTFETQSPTPEGPDQQVLLTDKVFIGEDDNSGGGSEAGLDASETYTLDFTGITPHPQQGFHVKLTINAEGSQGADVKHKVFWVTPCEETSTPTPSESETPSESPTTPTTPSTTPPGGEKLPPTGAGFPVGGTALVALFLLVAGGTLLATRGVIQLPYRRRH